MWTRLQPPTHPEFSGLRRPCAAAAGGTGLVRLSQGCGCKMGRFFGPWHPGKWGSKSKPAKLCSEEVKLCAAPTCLRPTRVCSPAQNNTSPGLPDQCGRGKPSIQGTGVPPTARDPLKRTPNQTQPASMNRDPCIIHLNIALQMVGSLYFGGQSHVSNKCIL